jgi:hypothetical protein
MVENLHPGEIEPRDEARSEQIEKAVIRLGQFRQSLLQIDTPNSKSVDALCLAQLILLTEDRQHTSTTSTGEPYSAEEEAIAVLSGVVRSLKEKRSQEISSVIGRIDPDESSPTK